jgi:zinc transport system substrate-binding protein
MPTRTLIFSIALFLKLAAPVYAEEPLIIYTVNYPLQYFAQRIAGDHAQVIFPAPSDQDPAFWMPDAEMIGKYQRADLILLNGANYAKWIDKVSLPMLKMIDTSAVFSSDYIATTRGKTHSHGFEGEHSHAGTAFTTWLDFNQATQQAEAIKNALTSKRPSLQDYFDSNFQILKQELLALDEELRKMTATQPDLVLMASHPVYQYLAHRYQIKLDTVLWEPGEFPAAVEWQNLEQKLIQHPAQWMIWEGKPLPESTAKLKSLGLNSLVFDPCSNQPETGDFMRTMTQNIDNLRKAYPGSD